MIQRNKYNDQVERASKHEPYSQWDKTRIQQAFMLALLGYTDQLIAEAMGVHERTLEYWKKKFPEFKQRLDEGKWKADALVANELFKNCFDRFVEVTEDIVVKGVKHSVTKKVLVASSVKAQLKWLGLRQRGLWGEDPTKAIHFNQTNIKIDNLDLSSLTEGELVVLKKFGLLQITQGESNVNYDNVG